MTQIYSTAFNPFDFSSPLVVTMQLPATPSLLFIAYTLVFLPYLAIRSGRTLHRDKTPAGQNETGLRWNAWRGTSVSLIILLVLAILTATTFDYSWFVLPPDLPFTLAASLIALGTLLGLRSLVRWSRSEEERKNLFVYRMVARTGTEWAMKFMIAILAGLSEEVAYRGVAMQILWYSTSNPWLSAIAISVSFSIAHYVQGVKSMLLIFLFALIMHVLVAVTATLWGAIVVHAIFDLLAMWGISKDARSLRQQENA